MFISNLFLGFLIGKITLDMNYMCMIMGYWGSEKWTTFGNSHRERGRELGWRRRVLLTEKKIFGVRSNSSRYPNQINNGEEQEEAGFYGNFAKQGFYLNFNYILTRL